MDYGPTIAAAFASPDVKEVRDLRRCIIDIMRNCPQDPMLVQQQRAGAGSGGGVTGAQAGRYGGAGAYSGGQNGGAGHSGGGGGGGYDSYEARGGGGPQPAPFQYPDERRSNGGAGAGAGAHEGGHGGGESSARYQMPHANSMPDQMSGAGGAGGGMHHGDDVSVLSGIVSEGVGYGFADSVSGVQPTPQQRRSSQRAMGMTWQG